MTRQSRPKGLLHGAAAVLLVAPAAFAGMPRIRINELAEARLESISFFLLVIALSTLIVRALWNWLSADFAFLPRLSLGRALSLVTACGLMFFLVLTMISGARELMTPGAWVRDGITYELVDSREAKQHIGQVYDIARRASVERLRDQLLTYAQAHEGELPTDPFSPNLPDDMWQSAAADGSAFIYLPGRRFDEESPRPIAYEPPALGKQRYVLLTSGQIEQWDIERITAASTRATDE